MQEWNQERSAKGWWHSFELPDGTRIDGVHPLPVLRQRIGRFPIAEDLRGKRVLDIGAWDGWYSFEMERRGAEVLAIDNWDNPRFRQVHALLDSRVEYRQMDMYDLTPDRIGRFDLVLFMGVLYHLKHPLLALERVCALTTEMAAVESFVLREGHCPGQKVEERSLIEFYETDEFGGQTDNWVGPSLPCLLAMCRTAGFARVELQSVTEYGVSIACHRQWEPPAANRRDAPRLLRVEHNTKGGTRFDPRCDEYVTAWFMCDEEDLGLNHVKPEVGGYGVRPIFVGQLKDGSWQTNFKLPPGLEAGTPEVSVRVNDGPPSNPKRITVNSFPEATPLPESVRANGGTNGAPAKPIDVQKVVTEIHARVRQEGNRRVPPVEQSGPRERSSVSSQDSYELTTLRGTCQRLYQNRNSIGKLPPSPNTLRAKIGGLLVRGVQRCLFWYTPQISQFQNDVIGALNSACNLIGAQSERANTVGRQVQRLRQEMVDWTTDQIHDQAEKTATLEKELVQLQRAVSEALNGSHVKRTEALEQEVQRLRKVVSNLTVDVMRPGSRRSEDGLPDSFQFALQDRFRGPEAETARKLGIYVEQIKALLPTLPRSRWLDLGCGRGEWLEAASQLGYEILGVDSNPASVRCCREKQLNVEERDAYAYLRSLSDASLAVVTAFHVVEHWPIQDLLSLVQEVVRVLQPGGIFIVETPNPGNLLMASANFWNDPTHIRPIPLKLLEFIYEYFGLTVVKRLELNPLPQDQRFAFDEISVVHRLNDHFYGPQDYGLIGRR